MITATLKKFGGYLVGTIIIGLIILGYYFANRSNAEDVPASFHSASSGQTYDYTEAKNHVGENASVKGKVLRVYTSAKGVIFFDYCQNYKSCPFSAVIFADDSSKFPNPTDYQGKDVVVAGVIKVYQGQAGITLNDLSQIQTE